MAKSKAKSPSSGFDFLSKAGDLKSRIFFTIAALIIFRFGAYIPLPGINATLLETIAAQNSTGILGMFNMLSGGSLARMSIFALAIMPYITSSIIMQLLSVLSKTFENLKKEGEAGKKKISQYTRYATVLLAGFQGYGLAVGLESMSDSGAMLVNDPGLLFRLTAVSTLVGGTLFLMWLGEQITSRGIGNGISLIIFSGIVAGLPSALAGTLELARAGALSPIFIIALFAFALSLVYAIVYMERAQRRIVVQYPKRQVGMKIFGGETSHLPLKLNTAGVIPPIFAGSLLLFPATIANFYKESDSSVMDFISSHLVQGKLAYIVLYVSLIIFFSFFYTAVIFNPSDTAENLKKNGGFIPGRRPGKNTAEYLDYILTRLTVIGAIYLALLCVMPEILIANYSVPFYLGGTSLLIVVNVILDTITQVQSHLFSYQYEGLLKKAKARGRLK
jgi:preprotein translocase subunit SecY